MEAQDNNGDGRGADSLGARIRLAREAKGIGVRELSRRVDVSASLISQIEHGRAMPSVMTLYAVSSELDVSLDELFGEEREPSPPPGEIANAEEPWRVHRKDDRQAIRFAVGVTWDLLNPGGTNGVEFLHVVYEAKGESTSEDSLLRHQGMEYGWVESGQLGVTVGFDTHILEVGDSISFPSTVPHRLFNPSDSEAATAVWVVIGRNGDPRTRG